MTDEQISTINKIRREAIPWAAIISAVAFSWAVVGQLITVRDQLVDNCHAMDVRISKSEQWQQMHDATDAIFRQNVLEIANTIRELRADLKEAGRVK